MKKTNNKQVIGKFVGGRCSGFKKGVAFGFFFQFWGKNKFDFCFIVCFSI